MALFRILENTKSTVKVWFRIKILYLSKLERYTTRSFFCSRRVEEISSEGPAWPRSDFASGCASLHRNGCGNELSSLVTTPSPFALSLQCSSLKGLFRSSGRCSSRSEKTAAPSPAVTREQDKRRTESWRDGCLYQLQAAAAALRRKIIDSPWKPVGGCVRRTDL